jgi:hypothetical protein
MTLSESVSSSEKPLTEPSHYMAHVPLVVQPNCVG